MTKQPREKKVRIPYIRKPDDMSVEQWQAALRQQFAETQKFKVKNFGNHPVFSDFQVYNPISDMEYKVSIRSEAYGMNFCSCPDFKVNELGTCKHVEFVLFQLKKKRGIKKFWKEGIVLPYSSLSLKYGRDRQVFLRIGTNYNDEIQRIATAYFNPEGFLKPEAIYFIEGFIEQVKVFDPHFKVYPDAMDYIIDQREQEKRRKKISELLPKGADSSYFDDLINTRLYTYQKEGIIFAACAGRVVLADDMGLGKTIQAIASAELLAKEFGISQILVICPTSLIYQWKSEIERFTDRSIQVIEGPLDKRKGQYQSEAFYKIASYGVALNDIDYLNRMGADLVILDEAQRIKNWKTKTSQNLKKLKTDFAFILTGTPLENRLEELHSLIEFVDRYKLGALFSFLDQHQIKDEVGKVVGYQNLNSISQTLSGVLLRRTRTETLDQLPERSDKNYYVDVTKEQYDIHEDYRLLVARLVAKWRKLGFLPEKDRERLMIALSCMRMVSDSTYILDQKTRHDTKIAELMETLMEVFERADDKVVIFSQWERMTRLVAEELDTAGIGYEYLHGGVPAKKRNDLINNFNNKPESRVFLSTDAGGVGLNLQTANIVINLDLPWNPAVLEQRIARVHRMGQQKPVYVINFISKGTIETRILNLIGFKKSVFKGVLDGGEDKVLMKESTFNKFMESVDGMVRRTDDDRIEAVQSEKVFLESNDKVSHDVVTRDKEQREDGDPLGALISAGMSLLQQLSSNMGSGGSSGFEKLIEKDSRTGKIHLKIPIKDKNTVVKAIRVFADLIEG